MRKLVRNTFQFKPFSIKQKQILSWWMDGSPYKDYNGIIADGAVRSGKTVSMAMSFVIWGNETFNGENLALCGKTIGSLRRNVIGPLMAMLTTQGYTVYDRLSESLLIIQSKGKNGEVRTNYYYLFGGKDESSQNLIQGITLAGILFDEVALMPQSFVNQATARCSVDGAKMWFNCNPQGPFHWFKSDWIEQATGKKLFYIHFLMNDNLTLSKEVLERYANMYTGVFYRRYILGEWVAAEGVIYSEFSPERHCIKPSEIPLNLSYKHISSDYGITNPQVYLKAAFKQIDGKMHCYILDEYYNVGDDTGNSESKTDLLFLKDYRKFVKHEKFLSTIIDPSAESLINLFRQNSIHVRPADNRVIPGIENVSLWLTEGRLHIVQSKCPNLIKEFGSYAWDPKAQAAGEDKPIKENDHALDALRYLLQTLYPIQMPVRIRTI